MWHESPRTDEISSEDNANREVEDSTADADWEDFSRLIYDCCLKGYEKEVEELLDRERDNNPPNVNWVSPSNMTPLFVAVRTGNLRIMQALIKAGADVNFVFQGDPYMNSCLMEAANLGLTNVVRFLIDAGANVSQRRAFDDRTALHYASEKGFSIIISMLLDNLPSGAVDTLTNYDGGEFTPLFIAAHYGHAAAVTTLINAGANVNFRCGSKQRSIILNTVIEGRLESVRLLLIAGSDPRIADLDGITPAYMAKLFGYPHIINLIERNIKVRLLAEAHAAHPC